MHIPSTHLSALITKEIHTLLGWTGVIMGSKRCQLRSVLYQVRMQGAGAWDGAEEGLSTYAIKQIEDTPLSNVEGNSGLPSNSPYGGNSVFPALLTDNQNNIHVAWVDSGNLSASEEIVYTRLNSTSNTGPGETHLTHGKHTRSHRGIQTN